MREIKFRAWDKVEKKWLLGYEYPNLGGFSMFGEVMMMGEYAGLLSAYFPDRMENIELMQFTGLLDKNGKEIYEGDVIDNEGARQKYEVIFHKGCFCISQGGLGFHIFNEKKAEVIGNIYENPDLINQV